jgi:50S ribosomal subunit-associated GTPase HflX
MKDCNRVVETQLTGRLSATALETMDFKERLEVVSAQRDAFDSENRSLKAELQKKEALLSQMSGRLDALERHSETNGTGAGTTTDTEATRRLIARVNELQQQLEAEQRKNRQLKGA